MATFSKATFSAISYAASRPTYPRALYDYVFHFHAEGGPIGTINNRVRWDTAVDLGCGTGQATVALKPFERIIGVDPSQGMVDAACRALSARQQRSVDEFEDLTGSENPARESSLYPEMESVYGRITYVQSAAEKLPFLSDGSVDMIIAAQAGHWFDWIQIWPETARVLRTDGTFAIWIYSQLRLPKYPTLTPLIVRFFQGLDPHSSIGLYWQQPGRSILDGHLAAVPDPNDVVPGVFKDMTRCYFTGSYHPHLPNQKPILLRKQMTWRDLYGYFRTNSALHTCLERRPEDAKRPEGDVGMRFWKSLLSEASVAQGGVTVQPYDEVEVEWPVAMILVKKA